MGINYRHEDWNSSSSSIHIAEVDSKNHVRPKLFELNLPIQKKDQIEYENFEWMRDICKRTSTHNIKVGIQALVAFTLLRHIPKTIWGLNPMDSKCGVLEFHVNVAYLQEVVRIHSCNPNKLSKWIWKMWMDGCGRFARERQLKASRLKIKLQ